MSAKKEFKFKTTGRMVSVFWEGGGEVPKELQGLYTSIVEAQKACSGYLAKRDKNAKGNSRAK